MTGDEMADLLLKGLVNERELAKLEERARAIEYILGEATALNLSHAKIAEAIAAGEHVLLDGPTEPSNT